MKEYIDRINNIQWDKLGTNKNKKIINLGYEYLRRLAKFYKDTDARINRPAYSNVVIAITNDIEFYINKKNVDKYCNELTKKAVENNSYRYTIEFYLQLAEYSITHPETKKYLNIYEPLIRLLEIGGYYNLKHNELEIEKVCMFPLGNWYERFKEKPEIDISEFYEETTATE